MPNSKSSVTRPSIQAALFLCCRAILFCQVSGVRLAIAQTTQQEIERGFKVAVINDFTYHDETYASILYTLSQFPLQKVVLFRRGHGDGMDTVMQPWFRGPVLESKGMDNELCEFDVIAFATFPDDANVKHLTEQRCDKDQIVIGVVHNPSRFLDYETHRETLQLLRPHLFTVSPHTAQYLKSVLFEVGLQSCCVVDFYVRIFPYFPPDWESIGNKRSGIVVPGKIDNTRRNYTKLFEQLADPSLPENHAVFPVSILGKSWRVPVDVPEKLQQLGLLKVVSNGNFHQAPMPYKEYYDTLSRSAAILPLFAGGTGSYLQEKASSSVPVSLVTLTPLLADDRLLHSYSYMREDAVIITPSDNFQDIAQSMDSVNLTQVVHKLKHLREVLLEKNVDKFKRILQAYQYQQA